MDDGLAKDLAAMWQSELTAMAADRELRESWAAMLALWASAATAALPLLPRQPHDAAPGLSHAAQPAGAPPALAASEPGLAQVHDLNRDLARRIAELEQRLAELERGTDGAA